MSPTTAERLAHERNLWLATVRPDGRPHLAPVWFVHDGGAFWVGTGAASVKVANLAHSPRATVALEAGDTPVVAETTVRSVARPFPAEVIAAFAEKYRWDLTVEVDEDVGEVVLLALSVDRWVLGGP